ncbi:MAG: hypothetical protein ACKV2V_21695 [Blastocatellia bacterium]
MRLKTRLEYLRRQYEVLLNVSQNLEAISGNYAAPQPDLNLPFRLEQHHAELESDELDQARRGVGQIGGELYEIQEHLHLFDHDITVFQIRTYFQNSKAGLDDVCALLQFVLSKLTYAQADLEKIDYLTTRFYSLSSDRGEAQNPEDKDSHIREEYEKMLDYAGITRMPSPDNEVQGRIRVLWEEMESASSFQQLAHQETLERLRAFKASLNRNRLHPEIMLELAQLNLLAGKRFEHVASRERERINQLADRLTSAGIRELEELQGEIVEDSLKSLQRESNQLNGDYSHNRQRIERIARVREAFSKANDRLGLFSGEGNDAARHGAMGRQMEADPEITAFEITPEIFRENLRHRLQQIARLLGEIKDNQNDEEMELWLDQTSLFLSSWETAAFQRNYPARKCPDATVAALLRVSVGMMAELREKESLFCRGMKAAEYRNRFLTSARYVTMFGKQLMRELEKTYAGANPPLPADLRGELQRTQRKLAGACTQFLLKIQASSN